MGKESRVTIADRNLLVTMIDQHVRELEKAKKDSIIFRLEGAVVPKARPRGTRSGHHYMPENYTAWKGYAIKAFQEIKELYPEHTFPLLKCSAFYILDGKHSRAGDGDNIAGALNDALVQAEVLKNDNLTNIPSQSISLSYDKKRPPSTLICLY